MLERLDPLVEAYPPPCVVALNAGNRTLYVVECLAHLLLEYGELGEQPVDQIRERRCIGLAYAERCLDATETPAEIAYLLKEAKDELSRR